MTRRSISALAVAAIMGLTACGGGGGSSALSEDDFLDEVNDLCADADADLDDIETPSSLDDIEDYAADTSEIFDGLQESLAEIEAPDDLADDFAEMQDSIEEIQSLLADLEEAGTDGDNDAVNDIADDLSGVTADLYELADDLGLDECVLDDTPAEPETTEPPETDATTVPPTAPAVVTLPPTVPQTAPPATAPPVTAPPATAPPVTETVPESTGALFEVVDLTTVFNDPFDFVMVDTGMSTALPFIEAVAAVPILNIGIDEMGVAALIDSFGDSVATLVVGVALEGFGMPEEWKTLICPIEVSQIKTTPAGYTGVYCPGLPGSGVIEIFTITEGDIGVSVALVDPFYSVLDVVDSFLLANF